ncbi:MAG: hypothetical protein IBX62_02145 [Coriobacteriia bacterium]|nr:hypothetical protein [Coriobacteriia bacterium]
MELKPLIDGQVRRKLEDTFGSAVAVMIMASATNAAAVPIMDPSREDFLRLVDAVCRDQRVLDMWGKAGAEDAARAWKELVG